VLLGPPVSGKGTQAELIRARYKIPTTSTGAETITIRMAQRLTCTRCGKIVSVGRHVSSVKEPCPNCGGPLEIRSDDNAESLKVRLEEFRRKSLPVIEFYRDKRVLAEIPADEDLEAVFSKIAQRVEE